MENTKIPFFKRIKSAIIDFESYSNFAVEKISVSIKYIAKLIAIFSIIISIAFSYKFSTIINNEEQLQILCNQIQETGMVDAIEVEKTINTIKDNSDTTFYVALTLNFFMYFFALYFVYGLIDAIIVSILGFLTSRLTRIRLKYKPIYVMSIYALTLPIILNCIYIVANTFTGFTIDYFQIVYNVIAYIYVITAILMIKTDFIEQQREIIKIVQEQRKVKYEQKEEKKEEKDKQPEDEDKDKEETPPEEPLGEANTESET